MAKQTDTLAKASEFIFNLFKEHLPEYLVYHTYKHSEMVGETARKIGKAMKLGEDGIEVVTLAGLFHDTGYTEMYRGHEEVSVRIATEFLEAENYPEEKIELIAGCIRATKVPQQPKNLLEEIIVDADLSGLGKKSFFQNSELLHIELEKALGVTFSEQEWAQQNLDLLTGHKYFTHFAQDAFGEQHTENIRTLYKKLRRPVTAKEEAALAKIEIERQKLARSAEKDALPERGTETMFKILSHNLMTISSLADHKAQTMIRSNAVIIAGVVSLVLRHLDELPQSVAIPMFMLLGVSVLTIFFSVLATRPKISVGITSREQITNRTSNLLFFGNFYKMSYNDFDWGIKEMMSDKDFLYSSLTQDSYFHARSVGKKYLYLNLSYSIFMYGLCITALTFFIFYLSGDSLSQTLNYLKLK